MSTFDQLSSDFRGDGRNDNRIYGVVSGIVKDIQDPRGLGRVRVEFPWLAEQLEETIHLEGEEERAHSYWARCATPMAGPERDTLTIPQVNDEVVVAFEHGRLAHPVVIGRLYNNEDRPPKAINDQEKDNIRSCVTRSGHKLVFDDSNDNPSMLIVDKTGKNRISINSKGNRMEIEVQGDLTITVGGKLTMTAGTGIAVETGADVGMKANANMNLEATGVFSAVGTMAALEGVVQTDVKGTVVSINSTAMTEVKGGIVKIN